MKTDKPFWYFIIFEVAYILVILYIASPLADEEIMMITRIEFIGVFLLGIGMTILFGIMMKYEWWGIPAEIDTLKEGVLFQIISHKTLRTKVFLGKDIPFTEKTIHFLYIEYDDEKNYDTSKYLSIRLENDDLENPKLFYGISNWEKINFIYKKGKICRMQ